VGTRIKRTDFKRQYALTKQGLFIFEKEKHIPKEQQVLNVGQELSKLLLDSGQNNLRDIAPEMIRKLLEPYREVTLSHIEILFSPSLALDPVAVLLTLCRNRKISFGWPGRIQGEKLFYEEPASPEYYEMNYRGFIDTYIITGGVD